MTPAELRRNTAERIRKTHKRQSDGARPSSVTISSRTNEIDVVVVMYPDGEIREFERLAPIGRDEEYHVGK